MHDPTVARRTVWRAGEDAACDHLRSLGFTVVDRNFRSGACELDVVARRGRLLVFCEVKARSSTRFGMPAEAVDARKAGRVRRCAAAWLAARRPGRVEVRFDVLSVIVRGQRAEVTHIPAAF